MEKKLRSSLHSSPQEFISLAIIQTLKSSKPSLKTLIHSIKPSSNLISSLPPSLCDSITSTIQSFQNLLQSNSDNPQTPLANTLRRSSRKPNAGTEQKPRPDKKGKLLQRLQILTHVLSLCVSHPKKVFGPSDLLPGVQALHDNLIVLEADSVLSSGIGTLCEGWWKENLVGRESLISQTLPFLLSRTLTLKKKVDVHRVYMLREAFSLFDFEDDSIEDLKLLLNRSVISPLFLKTEDGRKFLSFLFGLSDQLRKELLAMIRSQIPFGRKSMLEAYGDILFRAWKAAPEDSRSEIENGFLQDLVEGCIHASSGSFASYIRRVLGGFINQRTVDGIEKLLYRLAEPVIFRSLQAANSNVRQNALHLLLDVFPLEDPDAPKGDKDTLIDKQFFLLERLLVDDCPEIRTIAVEGSCRVLQLFWEVIPSPIITKMLSKIIGDMSHDVCNEVRLSTLNGIIYLLENPHSHEVLKVLCPRLGHLIQDNVLTVQVAMADLLLHLKDVPNFQFNKVVDLNLLLSELASDQPSVAQKITKLLIPSYFPSVVPLEEACNRCITLVKRAPLAGAIFCKYAILEGASKTRLMELVNIFLSLVLSPDKLNADLIEGFLVAASYLCDNLTCEACYKNLLKEFITAEKVKGLLTAASTEQAQSSLFNIFSTVCPDNVEGLLEEGMSVVTNCSGLPEDVDRQSKVRSAHKLLLSLGGFDDMFEALTTLLHKAAYRCHVKFGADMPSQSVNSKSFGKLSVKSKSFGKLSVESSVKSKSFAKLSVESSVKSKSFGKLSVKPKTVNQKQSFEDDYVVAVGVAWQIRDLLQHEDTRKAIFKSQPLEKLFFSLKMVSEISIVNCGKYEYIDVSPVLAYIALALQMTVDNVGRSRVKSGMKRKKCNIDSSTLLSETVLDLTIEHMLDCLEKLFGSDDSIQSHKVGSSNLKSTSGKKQNSTNRRRVSLTNAGCPRGSVHNEAQYVLCKVKMLTAVLKFIADTAAMCFAPHNQGLFLKYTSKCIRHIVSSLNHLFHNKIQFHEEDKKNTIICLKSSFSYAAKILNVILAGSDGSSITASKAFNLANNLLDLIVSIESCLGSVYASRLVSAARPWLPDMILALGSLSVLQDTDSESEHATVSEQMKLRFPKWPLVVVKTVLSAVNEGEGDVESSQTDKCPAFNKLLAMLIILLKKNRSIMDAVGNVFLVCSLVGLERKDFELALGLLQFVCSKLFNSDDRDWGDMMLSSLQEIYHKIEQQMKEDRNDDELEKLLHAKELLEPLWNYHLYESRKVEMTDV
ncbi:uncharacterized protein LOC127120476 [Lathyrus oleraceus]|uniref:uncharacterized protein LOC127120476 n=1 Tax=Pisum sativum TaxID=3888 RepID=UPI0021CE95B7|nr:uncharacterized protein LOC127120476 [Pisum sativum]